jgi:hypothetical protein
MKLSDTQSLILSAASQHAAGLATAPSKLPAAARNAVFRSLIKQGLLAEVPAPREYAVLAWRQDADDAPIAARITQTGLRAIGVEPAEGDAVADTAPTGATHDAPGETPAPEIQADQAAPTAAPRASLREVAAAVLAAWDDQANRDVDMIGALEGPMATLRAALAGKPIRDAGAARKPREGTKQEAVLTMLRRPEGATVAQIADAMGWTQHTVRGFFAGLKKKGHTVEVKSRERMVGPNKTGAKGSFTIYALCGAPHKR